MIIAAVVTGWVTRHRVRDAGASAVICAAAYASHLLLDWLGTDRYAAAWPSGALAVQRAVLHLRAGTSFRRPSGAICVHAPLVSTNLRARACRRSAIMGPIAAARCALSVRVKAAGRTCARDGRPRPSAAAADTAGTSDRRGRRAAR